MATFTAAPQAGVKASRSDWRAAIVASVGFWALFVFLATAYAVAVVGMEHKLKYLPADLALVTLGAIFSLGVRATLSRIVRQPFWRQIALAGLMTTLAAMPFEILVRLMLSVINGKLEPSLSEPQKLLWAGLFWLAPFALWAAINLALFHNAEARAHERRLSALRAETHAAQVRALRYQINPHFLYNTLNSIATLILDRRNEVAEAMVIRLSGFFRASLANDPMKDVSLAEEIALQRLYLEIEQVRFADTLNVEIHVPDELGSALIPGLILQPLIENALKHGVNAPGVATNVRVAARRLDDRLIVEVSDDGPGSANDNGTGIGLPNVRKRLEARFGKEARFDASSVPGEGFTASLSMPLIFA